MVQKFIKRCLRTFNDYVDGESVIQITHRHFWVFFCRMVRIVFTYFLITLGLILAYIYRDLLIDIVGETLFTYGSVIVVIIIATAAVIQIWMRIVDWKHDVLIVTNKRLIKVDQHFLFGRNIDAIYLKDIVNVHSFHQGFMETIFQFGNLAIKTAAEKENLVIKYISKQNKVMKTIQNQMQITQLGITETVEDENKTEDDSTLKGQIHNTRDKIHHL